MALLGKGRDAPALPIIEIAAPGGNYDYERKYFSDETQYFRPTNLSADVAEHIAHISEQAYRGVGLRRLGARRPYAGSGQSSLVIGNEYVAWYDESFSGAEWPLKPWVSAMPSCAWRFWPMRRASCTARRVLTEQDDLCGTMVVLST